VHKIILGTLTIAGLILSASTIASASPAPLLIKRHATVQSGGVQHVDYTWNHRRYKHRSWDKRHHRWRYY
jgi:hypothetical protein